MLNVKWSLAGHFSGHMFLILVDAHSKLIVAHILTNITATITTDKIRQELSMGCQTHWSLMMAQHPPASCSVILCARWVYVPQTSRPSAPMTWVLRWTVPLSFQ